MSNYLNVSGEIIPAEHHESGAVSIGSFVSEPGFKVGDLVQVDWDRLGEITGTLPGGYFNVWIEGDDRRGSGERAVHQSRLDYIS